MNSKSFELLKKFVPENYLQQAEQSQTAQQNEIRILIEKCKIPEYGWSESRIEFLLKHLSLMDSNNYSDSCGLGEREGRVFSNLVSMRHFDFSHGIGRSGDLLEVQPKAIGSSILNQLTNELVLDLLKISGLTFAQSCLVCPMATGMSLTFCMLSIRQQKPLAKYVLMPRMDQRSCIKSVAAAGFIAIIIENSLVGDELRTDLKMIESKITELKPENIACIFSITSCFTPRAIDKVEEIALICKQNDIFHLINNAYGLQSSKITHMINQASKSGRVDIVVQSTDKNLMVPVGGTILAAFDKCLLKNIAEFYPGRASSSQSLDVLITLLSMGTETYKRLLNDRKECFVYLKLELQKVAEQFGEKVLETPNNPISIGKWQTKI
jgi:O-phospho-L-seryl-tRNASec:L-selenocysteinyl-tRNA synthase